MSLAAGTRLGPYEILGPLGTLVFAGRLGHGGWDLFQVSLTGDPRSRYWPRPSPRSTSVAIVPEALASEQPLTVVVNWMADLRTQPSR